MIVVGTTPAGRTSHTLIRYLNFDFDFSDVQDYKSTTEETVLITEHEAPLGEAAFDPDDLAVYPRRGVAH